MSVIEAWVLMAIGIVFVVSQFIIPKRKKKNDQVETKEEPLPDTTIGYIGQLSSNGFIYAFCVFGLWIFVRECLDASFMMASAGIVSVAGVLIMFTSYVSSFPEFMMTYRYAAKGKKDALLGMLFGSNVIDLAFAGFRCIWTGEPMEVVAGELLPIYFWLLPVSALGIYLAIKLGKMRYKHAYPLMVGYLIYIISGFILL